MAYNDASSRGAFVPTTNVWDPSQIYNLENVDPSLRDVLVRLYQNLNVIALNVNLRDAGYYDEQEVVNGQLYFPNPALANDMTLQQTYRQVFRMTINFGALPNNATKTVGHNIPVVAGYSFTRMYATATNPTALTFIPIPYASTTAASVVELSADATNVYITTHSNMTGYSICYVVLEYLKQ
jgi:hypothetical protein